MPVSEHVRDQLLQLHEWLLSEGIGGAGPINVGNEMCRRLVEIGVPLHRGHVLALVLHPLHHGRSFHWRPETGSYSEDHPHGLQHLDGWARSIFRASIEGDLPKVCRFDLSDPEQRARYSLLEQLHLEGMTEYVAIRLSYSTGMHHAMSFATRQPGGFSEQDVAILAGLERVMAVRLESAMRRDLGEVVLATYLGVDPAKRVLAGNIRRGDVETIDAVIWMSDLRDFTRLSEELPPEALVELLSDYFEAVVDTVRGHGGEVLKFVGDAILAVFRTNPDAPRDHACRLAARAARRASDSIDALVRRRVRAGKSDFDFGIGLHIGEVAYGNVGARDRLDFTVIGPAVNLASRIEGLCGELGHRVLVSQTFAETLGEPCSLVDERVVRGIREPVQIFTLQSPSDGPG